MSVLRDLRETGRLSDDGAQLLYDTVAAVVRFSSMPPPRHYRTWSAEAVIEVAHDFLAHAQTKRRLATIALEASDDASAGRLLETAVRNYLRDQARATDRGALMRRLRDVLAGSERFVQVPPKQVGAGRWVLVGAADVEPWGGNIDDLVAASWEADGISVVRWASARRRGPTATRETLERFVEVVLREARGAVRLDDLARVAEQRFDVGPVRTVALDQTDEPAVDESDSELEGVERDVGRAWAELSARERVVLANHELTVRELAPVLHVGKSAAAESRRQLVAKLKVLLGDCDNPDAAVLTLVEEARSWLADRTTGSGVTSDEYRHTTLDGEPPR